jgi:hypothetical protein
MHSRFEHSLGAYHVAGQAVEILDRYQGHELGIDRSDLRTVKLAGVKSCSLLSDLIDYSLGQTSVFNMASPPCPTLMFQFSSYFGSQNMHHASYVSSEAISIANT